MIPTGNPIHHYYIRLLNLLLLLTLIQLYETVLIGDFISGFELRGFQEAPMVETAVVFAIFGHQLVDPYVS